MTLDLTDHEAALLLKELNGLIDGDRYFLFERIKTLKAIRAKIRPEAAREPRHRPLGAMPRRGRLRRAEGEWRTEPAKRRHFRKRHMQHLIRHSYRPRGTGAGRLTAADRSALNQALVKALAFRDAAKMPIPLLSREISNRHGNLWDSACSIVNHPELTG